jgi:hypothetical protein
LTIFYQIDQSEFQPATRTDVRTDVLALCRICHARAHHDGNKNLLTLEELKASANDTFKPLESKKGTTDVTNKKRVNWQPPKILGN